MNSVVMCIRGLGRLKVCVLMVLVVPVGSGQSVMVLEGSGGCGDSEIVGLYW